MTEILLMTLTPQLQKREHLVLPQSENLGN